jgi:hypothetical protein
LGNFQQQSAMIRQHSNEINALQAAQLQQTRATTANLARNEAQEQTPLQAVQRNTLRGRPQDTATPSSMRVVFTPRVADDKTAISNREKSKSEMTLAGTGGTCMGVGELLGSATDNFGGGTSTSASNAQVDEDHDQRWVEGRSMVEKP